MIYPIIVFLLLTVYFYLLGKKTGSGFKYILPAAFTLKMAVGILFTLLFSNLFGNTNLTADADVFMHDSKILHNVAFQNFKDFIALLFTSNDHLVETYLGNTTHWDSSTGLFMNDSRFIIRFHALLYFLSLGHVTIHIMATNVISMFGILFLTKSFGFLTRLPRILCFLLLLLAPNILFWTSSIIKEPFIIFGIGLTMWALTVVHRRWLILALTCIGISIVLQVKMYVGICFIATILLYTTLKFIPTKIVLSIGVLTLFAIPALLFTSLGKKPVEKISRIQFDFNNIGKGGIHVRADTCIYVIQGEYIKHIQMIGDSVYLTQKVVGEYLPPNAVGTAQNCEIEPNEKPWIYYDDGIRSNSYIETTLILNDPAQLLKNIPEALSVSLLRPWPNDPPNHAFKWISILDNMWIYGLLLFSIIKRRKISFIERNAIIAFLTFVLLLALIIGWTTPVMGAVIRYKVPIQLAIVAISAILLDPGQIPFLKLANRNNSK